MLDFEVASGLDFLGCAFARLVLKGGGRVGYFRAAFVVDSFEVAFVALDVETPIFSFN